MGTVHPSASPTRGPGADPQLEGGLPPRWQLGKLREVSGVRDQ